MCAIQNCGKTGSDCIVHLKTSQVSEKLLRDQGYDDETDRQVYLMAVIHQAGPWDPSSTAAGLEKTAIFY